MKPKITEAGFWAKVDKSGGTDACWSWTGFQKDTGYGLAYIGGNTKHAHRHAYALYTSTTIPADLCVMHLCDNRIYCNPRHLKLGTHKENMQDMKNKNRGRSRLRSKTATDRINKIMEAWRLIPKRPNGMVAYGEGWLEALASSANCTYSALAKIIHRANHSGVST